MWPFSILGVSELWGSVVVFLCLVFSINLLGNYMRGLQLPIRKGSKAHSWRNIQHSSESWVCNVCESLLVSSTGVYCDWCGVCADPGCIRKADSTLRCKDVTYTSNQPMNHHWHNGNLRAGSLCAGCSQECSLEPGLVDVQCAWCHRASHSHCLPNVPKVCDFGDYRRFVVPPANLRLERGRPLEVTHPPHTEPWTPLLVLGNSKSGNRSGSEVVSGYRRVLNPAQVIDLGEGVSPSSWLGPWLRAFPPTASPIVLVAGGDGTAAWVLTTIHSLKLEKEPGLGVVPLGTGNDLSRVLGWGKEEPSPFCAFTLLQALSTSKSIFLDRCNGPPNKVASSWACARWFHRLDINNTVSDFRNLTSQSIELLDYFRWRVNIEGSKLGLGRGGRSLFMYNYLSIGVDAQVTLDFHRTRQSPFYIVSSRIINKMVYLTFGTQQVMERGCRNLDQRLELLLEGKRVPLPPLESIVVLNIPSWGAGVHLWTLGSDEQDQNDEERMGDGKLEVAGIYSAFHIAQLQVGLSQPHRVGQAKQITIKLKAKTPMQVDGEPWMQGPATIEILSEGQVHVLANTSATI